MAERMPPPGTGKGVAIIIGEPKGGDNGKMPPPGGAPKQKEGKSGRDEAGFVDAANHCIDCENYDPQTGECSKVEGVMSPDDACVQYFEPVEDQEGDNDADDQQPMAGGMGQEDSQQ